ncbi:hypothetical protein AAT37_27885, partial [Salmonella enterica]|nr:hypothetical protein [Salmonella enterica]
SLGRLKSAVVIHLFVGIMRVAMSVASVQCYLKWWPVPYISGNVWYWHRADALTELKVGCEREADVIVCFYEVSHFGCPSFKYSSCKTAGLKHVTLTDLFTMI